MIGVFILVAAVEAWGIVLIATRRADPGPVGGFSYTSLDQRALATTALLVPARRPSPDPSRCRAARTSTRPTDAVGWRSPGSSCSTSS